MNISYVAHIRLPTEKAHGWQIMRVCNELARQGHAVTLYVARRANALSDDPHAYYGLEKNFEVVFVRCIDALRLARILGPLAFWISEWTFMRSLTLPADAVVYTRDYRTLSYLAARGYRCFYGAHNWKLSRARYLARACGVVCNSEGTREAVLAAITLPAVVIPNAADPNPYVDADARTLRIALGLPDGPLALYAGHLYDWKGISILLQAARLVPDVHVIILGGTSHDIARAGRSASPNVSFLGHRGHASVPRYLAAADVLLLPNTARSDESARFTAPLKLFEYLAAGKPIVASDLPSLRAFLSERTAFLIPPDDAHALAAGIRAALSDTALAKKRAASALAASKEYTWESHAHRLAEFFSRYQG